MTINLSDYVVDEDATILQAVAKMTKNRARTVVLTRGGKITGLLSEGDVLRALLRGTEVHMQAREAARTSFRFLTSVDYDQAFEWFKTYAFGLVPVVDQDFVLVGVITIEDMLQRVDLRPAP